MKTSQSRTGAARLHLADVEPDGVAEGLQIALQLVGEVGCIGPAVADEDAAGDGDCRSGWGRFGGRRSRRSGRAGVDQADAFFVLSQVVEEQVLANPLEEGGIVAQQLDELAVSSPPLAAQQFQHSLSGGVEVHNARRLSADAS
jgi:hypothetical protein